jgi:hypothetical protein
MQDVLTKSNRDEWFQKLETIAAGEDMSFLLTQSLNEYSTVKEIERDTEPGVLMARRQWELQSSGSVRYTVQSGSVKIRMQ